MFSFFKKKDKNVAKIATTVTMSKVKPLDYHPKIILAWARAIEGNDDLMRWLKENGYLELTMATFAIYLKDEAREWLLKNGYPQLMAMINASEGNETAQKWLLAHDFELLYHIGLAVDDDQDSWDWLGKNVTPDIFLLTQSIKKVKDQIEENHNDVHSFGRDI